MKKNKLEFLGPTRKDGKVVVALIPFEGKVSFQTGAKKGPDAIIDASWEVEYYDEELDAEPASAGIETFRFDVGKKEEENFKKTYEQAKKIAKDKFLIGLGGDHSVSLGLVKAAKEKCPNLCVLQLDAHADLRKEYNKSKYNHACAVRNMLEMCDCVQVGIRSMSREEADFLKDYDKAKWTKIFYAKDIAKDKEGKWIWEVVDALGDNVYITIDIDALDPSVMPSTGTPVPGGLSWYDVTNLLREVFRNKNVVGCDVVELAPIKGLSAPDFTAAKLVYKLIGYKFFQR